VEDLRCAQAVLLPALLDATLEDTAAALGVGRATVARLQGLLRRRVAKPTEARPNWGGRRRASMSIEQEREFLAPWTKQADEGGVLVVSPLRAALAQELGHPVAASWCIACWRAMAGVRSPGHSASQERPCRAGGMEKKLPEALAALLSPKQVCGAACA
jgi:hypothetical protein